MIEDSALHDILFTAGFTTGVWAIALMVLGYRNTEAAVAFGIQAKPEDHSKAYKFVTKDGKKYFIPHVGDIFTSYPKGQCEARLVPSFEYTIAAVHQSPTDYIPRMYFQEDMNHIGWSITEDCKIRCPEVPIKPEDIKAAVPLPDAKQLEKFVDEMK